MGVQMMHGSAKSIDLARVRHDVREIKIQLRQLTEEPRFDFHPQHHSPVRDVERKMSTVSNASAMDIAKVAAAAAAGEKRSASKGIPHHSGPGVPGCVHQD